MAVVVVVGLGPAGPELITQQALEILHGDAPVWLRTRHHPAAAAWPAAATFDDVYDTALKVTDVYPAIVEQLVNEAQKHHRVVYAVPGSPLVAEHTVELLRQDSRVETEIVPALSFLELMWSALGIDPLTSKPRIVDGQSFATDAAGQTGALIVSQVDSLALLSEIKLAYEDNAPLRVTVVQRLGLSDQNVFNIAWEDLDRVVQPDHLTTLWIEDVGVPIAHDFEKLHTVARELRDRCPWDHEQTHASLERYALEETYELIEAIDQLADTDDDEHLIEELGDVLFQVFAHSAIAEEDGRFNITDVVRGVTEKLVERHPHVYGDVVAETADDVKVTWEADKMRKKGRTSVFDGIPRTMPALMYTAQVVKKAKQTDDDLEAARQQAQEAEATLMKAVDNFVAAYKARQTP